jgi:hypothetical protein
MSHKYTHKIHTGGFEYCSVTTIIGDCTDKSAPLMGWSAKMVCEWIRQNCDIFNHVNDPDTVWGVTKEDLDNAKMNYREVSKDALDIGSEVHSAIEHYLKTGIEPKIENEKVLAAFVAFLEWKDEHQLFPLALEETVYGAGFGGMLDYRGIFDGKQYVIDWKSSKAIYASEMGPQIAAYRFVFPDVEGCGILRLDKDTGLPEWKDFSDRYERDLKTFHLMRDLYYQRHPILAKKAGWEG